MEHKTAPENKMDKLTELVMDIHRVVLGTEHEKDLSLLSRVRDLEEKTLKQEKNWNMVKWIGIGWSIPTSVGIIEFLKVVIKSL